MTPFRAKEPVQERDRFFMAMLKPLGIEPGKPFAPTARQQKILTEAARLGELMAKANTYTKRFEAPYWPGSRWKDVHAANTTQREANFEQLDERASYFYEAVAISSRNPKVVKYADSSTDVHVAPTAPAGFENNWVQTNPGAGWFVLYRFYGPTESLFKKSWELPDFDIVK